MEIIIPIIMVFGAIFLMFCAASAATVGVIEVKHKVRRHNHRREVFESIRNDILTDISALNAQGKINCVEIAKEVLRMADENYAEVKTNGDVWRAKDIYKKAREITFDLVNK